MSLAETVDTREAAPKYIRRRAAAEYMRNRWGVPVTSSYLCVLASEGGGPRYRKIGGKFVFYTLEDLDAWVAGRTSEVLGGNSPTQK